MTFQTGCSSSLVGLHEACQALYSGDCSSAIVAGTNLIVAPTMTTTMSDNMVLSPSGVCRTFDAKADGYGRGEAINAIYIKRLDDALRDGDPVRAVIRSTSTNCDGKTPSITTPGSATQEELIREAYQKAQIDDISQTAFFDCHGTGTVIGDTAETSDVANLFKEKGTFIGAVGRNAFFPRSQADERAGQTKRRSFRRCLWDNKCYKSRFISRTQEDTSKCTFRDSKSEKLVTSIPQD